MLFRHALSPRNESNQEQMVRDATVSLERRHHWRGGGERSHFSGARDFRLSEIRLRPQLLLPPRSQNDLDACRLRSADWQRLVSISTTLAYLVYKASKSIPFNWVFLAFGLFIVSCGFTHFMEVWVIWQPVYWLSGYVKVVTAAASVATAIALFPLVPKVFSLINSVKQAESRRKEIERLNAELERFNYSVAHNLRAPLRTRGLAAQIIVEDYSQKLDAEGQSTLHRIQQAMHRMDTMLIDLLKYTGVMSQTLELKPLDLRAVIDQALNALRADIAELKARVEVAADLPRVVSSDTLSRSFSRT